jgi:pyrroline-5-carboxylate reductase
MTKILNKKICFLGSGNMAEAIINGIIDKVFYAKNILCVDLSDDRLQYLSSKYKTDFLNINDTANFVKLNEIDVFILAVKPNNASEILQILKNIFTSNSLIISIMAGVKIAKIKNLIDSFEILQVVRVMPNTPALVGEGAIGYSFCENVSLENKELTERIFTAIGVCKKIDEKDLDAVTALSGSGPAYIFYFAEAMIEAGLEMGLTNEVSRELAIQTIYGAGLLMKNSDEAPETLRAKVTSKGGTTHSAITCFDENNMKQIIKTAIQKAKSRSIEMSL